MKIFFSYPHDKNSELIKRLKADLEERGHEVWFDEEKIKTGDEWRARITQGILDSQQVVAFLSKHSVRDPGVCLNEIAIALADKGEAMVTVLVEPEHEVQAPVSITHIQWLRMEDWHQKFPEDEGWYRTQFDKLVQAIESPSNAGRHEELETLRLALDPMSFHAEMAPHIPGFTGRQWIIDRYQRWLAEETQSRVLRIEGGPGLGKTAVSSYLAHSTKSSVLGVHLCQYNKGDSRNPLRLVRTLAYQLATRLPDYRARLLKTVAIQRPETMRGKDPATLWSDLISAPLAGSGGKGVIDRQRLAIIIDGLDEATVDGKNPIVELLASEINQLPKWIGVVLTGRPDPELTQRLARFAPLVLRDDDPANLADLEAYCNKWLEGEVKDGKLSPAQASAASQTLLRHSHGAFLYLSQARIAVTEGMLDLARPDSFPSGLTEIYQRFFERRFPDAWEDASHYKHQVRPFLELVLASPEPLPLPMAGQMLGWDAYAEADVLRSLGSLIKRTKGEAEDTVAPFHNSVREWLQDADAAGDFFISTQQAKPNLTTAVWERYLERQEQDAYAWEVLPELLPALSPAQQDSLFGGVTRETSQILYRLAHSLAPKLRFREAAATWRVQVRFSERLTQAAPENANYARDLSISYNHLGDVELMLGQTGAAAVCYQKALAIRELQGCSRQSDHDNWVSYIKLGDAELNSGNAEAALAYNMKALVIAERQVELDAADAAGSRLHNLATALSRGSGAAYPPIGVPSSRHLAISYDRLGDSEVGLGNLEVAFNFYQKGLAIAERLYAITPKDLLFARDLSISYNKIGDMELRKCGPAAALSQYKKGLIIREQLVDSNPESTLCQRDLRVACNKLGDAEMILGCHEESWLYYQKGLEIAERLALEAPEIFDFNRDLSVSYNKLGDAEATLGDDQHALILYQMGMAIREQLVSSYPENTQYLHDLWCSYNKLGDIEISLGRFDVALGYCQKAVQIAERFVDAVPESAQYTRDLSTSQIKLTKVAKGEMMNKRSLHPDIEEYLVRELKGFSDLPPLPVSPPMLQ